MSSISIMYLCDSGANVNHKDSVWECVSTLREKQQSDVSINTVGKHAHTNTRALVRRRGTRASLCTSDLIRIQTQTFILF